MSVKMKLFVENENGACRLCTRPDEDEEHMVRCDDCDRWFHLGCAKLTVVPTDSEPFLCIKCNIRQPKPSTSKATSDNERSLISELVDALKSMKGEANSGTLETLLRRETMQSLPVFDGKPRDWPLFKKTLEETTKQGSFSDLENLSRLQRCLRGEAEKCVKALMLDPKNVDAIKHRLEETFGRPELVYRELVRDVIKVRVDHPSKIPELADAIDNLVTNVTVLDCTLYLNDPRLIDDLVNKLPLSYQLKWIEHVTGPVTLIEFNKWLGLHARNIRRLSKPANREHVMVHDDESEQSLRYKAPKNKRRLECPECKGNHWLENCPAFGRKDCTEKWAIIKRIGLCHGCLRYTNHRLNDCKLWRGCNINGCTARHHPAMHDPSKGVPTAISGAVNHHGYQRTQERIYYQVVPVTLRNGPVAVETFALLDGASSLTLLENTMADQLKLEGAKDPLTMKWTGEIENCDHTSRRVRLTVQGTTEHEHTLDDVRTIDNLNLPVQSLDAKRLRTKYKHLLNVPVKSFKKARPTLLIGLNNSHLIVPINRQTGPPTQPIAIETKLGWIVFGKEGENTSSARAAPERLMTIKEEERMDAMIKKYFSTEDFGVKETAETITTEEEKRTQAIIQNTLRYDNGRYEIGLLWKSDEVFLPNSYDNALGRLKSLERQLGKQPALREWAIQTFTDYEKKGYIRKLTPVELLNLNARVFFLPHFIVTNKNKPNPKPRLVFDAAAKIQGISLNSQLMTGPDGNAPLFGILLRFREGQVAVAGDIKEMFHQVKVRPEDQFAQSILWRGCDEQKHPEVYVMQVMTFGAPCSPSCAQIVKNENALRCKKSHSKAYDAIVKQHYVDDYIDSFDDEEEAIETTTQVIAVHDQAGFYIRNFISNCKRLLQAVPPERQKIEEKELSFEDKSAAYEKILGVFWESISDTFVYKSQYSNIRTDILKLRRNPTKREVISFVMSVYDPLGLISHITIHGRILFRSIVVAIKDWDEEIPKEPCDGWQKYLQLLEKANNFEVPRCIKPPRASNIELHTFVDASIDAFAACVYVRSLEGSTAGSTSDTHSRTGAADESSTRRVLERLTDSTSVDHRQQEV